MRKKLIFLSLSIISGCANLEPVIPTINPNIPEQWANHQSIAFPVFNWNQIFTSSIIQRDIILALDANKEIKKASLSALKSHQLINTINGPLTLSTGTTGDYQGNNTSVSEFNGFLKLVFDIDLWGRIESEVKSASLNAEASDFTVKSVQDAIASEVIRAHLIIAYANQYHAVLDEMDKILLTLEDKAKARIEEGLLNDSDLSRIRIKRGVIITARAQTEYKKSVAIEALKILTSYQRSSFDYAQTIDEVKPFYYTIPNPTSSSIIFNRPDIKSLNRKMTAANAQIGVAKANRLPQLSLPITLLFPAHDTNIWEILPFISQVIFDNGKLKAIEQVTTTERDLALVEYEIGIQSAYRDVANGIANVKMTEQEVDIAIKSQKIAQNAFNRTYARNSEGVESLSDLIDRYDDLFITNSQVVIKKYERAISTLSLFAAAGVGV